MQSVITDFVSDGMKWAELGEEQKLLHLWKKLKRTEGKLKESHQECKTLKEEGKKEMKGVEDYLANIRQLSSERNVLMHQLEIENDKLRKENEQLLQQRDAFLDENKAVMELLLKEGLQQYTLASTGPRQPVEKLLLERNKLKANLEKLELENKSLSGELERAKSKEEERQQKKLSEECASLQAKLSLSLEEKRDAESRLFAEKKKHEENKQMLGNQIQGV